MCCLFFFNDFFYDVRSRVASDVRSDRIGNMEGGLFFLSGKALKFASDNVTYPLNISAKSYKLPGTRRERGPQLLV